MADAAQRWEPPVAGGTGTDEVQETARDTAEELKETVRESSTQLSSTAREWMQQEADQRTSAIASQARTIAGAMRQTSARLTDDGQAQAARVTDTVAERVDAQRMTEGMRGGMSDTTSTMQHETGEMTHRVRSGMQRGKRMAEDNPLLVAVGAVAAGFLIGAALPGTPMEDERIGPKSDEVKSQAMQRGSEMIERAGDKAQETVQRTTDQARSRIEEMREGSTSGGESTGSLPPTGTYGTTR